MTLLPLLGVGAAVGAGTAAAGHAASAASQSFAALLRGAIAADSAPPSASAPVAASGETADPANLNQRLQSLLRVFREQWDALLAEHGLDAPPLVRLQSDGLGGLRIADPDPQAGEIEQLVNAQPHLAALFAAIERHARQLRDPSSEDATFELSLAGDQIEPAFVEPGA